MFKILALVFIAASFAVADDDMNTNTTPRMSTNDETINEYVKEYLKITTGGSSSTSSGESPKVESQHLKVRLYSTPNEVVECTLNDYSNTFRYPQYNSSLETKIFLNGWLEKDYPAFYKTVAQLYALRGKRVNLISVDWSKYAFLSSFYYTSQEVVPKVAEYLAPFVQFLMNAQNNNKVHLIGFDMGAHIAGITGKRLSGTKVARITGLSPAGRYYNDMSEENRLAKGDASYVDIIHTNMGGEGMGKVIGDVDFLPNGGRQQPASERKTKRVEKDIVSHMLARSYYVESIEVGYAGFIGKKCDSWTNFLNQRCAYNEAEVMGETISQKVNGTVYLSVDKLKTPYYSKGIYGVYPYQTSQVSM